MNWPNRWAVNDASSCEEWELNPLDTKVDVHWNLSKTLLINKKYEKSN